MSEFLIFAGRVSTPIEAQQQLSKAVEEHGNDCDIIQHRRADQPSAFPVQDKSASLASPDTWAADPSAYRFPPGLSVREPAPFFSGTSRGTHRHRHDTEHLLLQPATQRTAVPYVKIVALGQGDAPLRSPDAFLTPELLNSN